MLLLKALLLKSVATSDEPEGSSSNCAAEDDYDAIIRSRRHMVQYYVDYCAMVRRRIASSSSKLVVGERNYSCGSESDRNHRNQFVWNYCLPCPHFSVCCQILAETMTTMMAKTTTMPWW